ncbi:MAG TPA: helix-turn-helix transcriptional regulator, partial [Steroidobacteraceae bacterium]|nr:helix-turn-helix transcriptional regulator [Steroidobacteraceae bacterium]
MDAQADQLAVNQVKAARALLAWSQTDLAKAASVATSTIADFERGSRTPIPNNVEAIRASLEAAGIRFLPGGVVIGPAIPTLAPLSKAGAPIRFVDATDLFHWADRRDGQGSLPRLISTLIRAGATGPISLRFPADEGVQRSGWDGVTDVSSPSDEYVPAGLSGWEIGTQRSRIKSKANDDYKERTENPQSLLPANSTFVFVTPRDWPQKAKWIAEKKAQGVWRDVQAHDGTDLIHWMEKYPAVGNQVATYLGKRPAGSHQLEEVWSEWSRATELPLTAHILLAGRDDQATQLLRWLRAPAAVHALQGESAEEVVAFLHATMRELPPDVADHYFARCLVVTTAEAARRLSDSMTPLILVLVDPEPGLAHTIAQKGNHVFLAYDGNPSHGYTQAQLQKLARPLPEDLKTALRQAGVKEEKARSLAHDSARSLAILRRLMASQPGRVPAWAQASPARELLAVLLAGAWDEASAADKAAVSQLADKPYDEVIAALVPYTSSLDRPLRKVGSVWKVASPRDAWMLLAPYLSTPDIDRFEHIITDVLGTADPRFELDPSERWYADLQGVRPHYSTYLRHGLGEVLILLALFGHRAETVCDANELPNRVVRKLLEHA